MKKLLTVLTVFLLVLAGCGSSSNAAVVSGGSTSVQPLLENMIEDYNALNPDKEPITYDGTGSSTGVENVINGTYDVGAASREVKDEEKQELDTMNVEALAYDGIAVVVNPENTAVTDLTMDQLRAIYTGEITNWSDLGGSDSDIAVISRDSASGTRGAFEEIVGFEGELTTSALESASNGEVMNNVANNEYAIGYVSFDYLDDTVSPVMIDGAEPTVENVINNSYGISRPFNLIWDSENDNQDVTDFINWVLENKDEYAEDEGLITS